MGVVVASNDDNDEQHPSSEETDDQGSSLPMAREDLLKMPVKIGKAKMTAIFDMGSQINILSKNLVEQAGLL